MNKRDVVLSLLDTNRTPEYIPAAFFLHFDPAYHRGQAAVDKHLEYFRYTGMDFLKIQYEHGFPKVPAIRHPEDWLKMPFYKLDFYEAPLRVVEGLVKAVKAEALVVLTLYSPFMCAGHTTSDTILTEHICENPAAVQRGMEIITESLMLFVKECIRLGVDGFYTSTQGGEEGRFTERILFDQCVRRYDLALMGEINRQCMFNILHICDYNLPYRSLEPYLDYPGQVVNASLELTKGETSATEVSRLFRRPFMGGLNRKGILLTGTVEQVRSATLNVMRNAPPRFILGADCTVPAGENWNNLRTAIETAHTFRR
jgi:uroporphyrinogen decarboxylase